MNSILRYYLENLATSDALSSQAKALRDFLSADDDSVFSVVKEFIAQQQELHPDTEKMLHIAIMPGYGSEYNGLGGSDWFAKAAFFKSLSNQFPHTFSFKCKYADCACMAGIPVEEFYPVLEAGMLQDASNKYYPSAELFEAIQESIFNFQFDLLLVDKYRQPCSKEDFEIYITELKEEYYSIEQLKRIDQLQWKG